MKTLDRAGRSELHNAACDSNFAAVERLVAAGADVNLQDKRGWAPLHFAAQARSQEITKYLIAHGAIVDLEDANGNTPLGVATFNYRGDGAVIIALRAAGADPYRRNKSGVSPLSLARKIANYDVAKFYDDIKDA